MHFIFNLSDSVFFLLLIQYYCIEVKRDYKIDDAIITLKVTFTTNYLKDLYRRLKR